MTFSDAGFLGVLRVNVEHQAKKQLLKPFLKVFGMTQLRSNPQPPDQKADALSIEPLCWSMH